MKPTAESVAKATEGNRSFSRQVPGLQLAVDSTSLGTFKECPRKYYLRHIRGVVPKDTSVHLVFGLLLHQGCEVYDHARAKGADHRKALLACVRWGLKATWANGKPVSWNHPEKNRLSLIRALVWHLNKFNPDPCETVLLANGQPAVELSFTMSTGLKHGGEDLVLCGHLDKIVSLGGFKFIKDIKTTSGALNPWFFDRFNPDNQMSLYDVAGSVVLEEPISGVIVDAIQIGAGFVRSERGLVPRSAEQRQEWLEELGFWLRSMSQAAQELEWPMNDKSCHNYGGCPYRGICSKSPGLRETEISQRYFQETWDPLVRRGQGPEQVPGPSPSLSTST